VVLPVTLELELRDNVDVVLELKDSVADTLVLPVTLELVLWVCDTAGVTLELELRDTVELALNDVVADTVLL
jgi:hypothetical protein